jgi:glycosyltransferase involved in cell wall biosynthesis
VRVNVLALCADPGIAYDGTKGASVHLRELWRALAAEGALVSGVAAVRGAVPPELPPGVALHALPGGSGSAPPSVAERVLAAARAAVEAPGAPRPDFILERLALDSAVGATLARRLGVPLVVEVNAPLDEEAARYRGATPDATTQARLRETLAAADLVVCVSRPLVPWVVAHGGSAGRTQVLPNGVRVDLFGGPRIEASPGAPVTVGFVGSFKPWHGLDLLLDAWLDARVRGEDLRLELLGDGPVRERLEARVAAAGATGAARFHGARPHEEVAAFLRGIDIAVAPSPPTEDPYFSPLKVYEYAAAGCAIVAPSSGQAGERFQHERDALLVPPGDARALADALLLLSRDAALRRSLGAAARVRARREFDWRHVARRLLDGVGDVARDARSAS